MNGLMNTSPQFGQVLYPAPQIVLLAEADDELRKLLADWLRDDGYRVVEVTDGLELLDYLEGSLSAGFLIRPDVIVSDVDLPGWGGLEACERLHVLSDGTPFILLSPSDDLDIHCEAEKAGAMVVDKPLDLEELREAISAVLPC